METEKDIYDFTGFMYRHGFQGQGEQDQQYALQKLHDAAHMEAALAQHLAIHAVIYHVKAGKLAPDNHAYLRGASEMINDAHVQYNAIALGARLRILENESYLQALPDGALPHRGYQQLLSEIFPVGRQLVNMAFAALCLNIGHLEEPFDARRPDDEKEASMHFSNAATALEDVPAFLNSMPLAVRPVASMMQVIRESTHILHPETERKLLDMLTAPPITAAHRPLFGFGLGLRDKEPATG